MGQALAVYTPIFAFMLLPVWIPIIAVVCGRAADAVRTPPVSAAKAAVDAAKERSLLRRSEIQARVPAASPAPTVAEQAA
ncbi:hypothetical protein FXB39_02885 [Nocardioides sp. BGMRC 2183]|nr:hypothetical protein FXB39_02885 [Nocardioides sp. BGMRC 2183]